MIHCYPSQYKNMIILAETPKYLVGYKRGTVIVEDKESGRNCMRYRLYNPIQYLLSQFKLIERLLRLRPRVCFPVDEDSYLLSIKGKLLLIVPQENKVSIDTIFPNGTNNPLYFCNFIESGEKKVAYGEYCWDSANRCVNAFVRNRKGEWSELFHFLPNTVLHIHNIIYDELRHCFWILTGDSDNESGIWKYCRDKQVPEPFLVGSQQFRSCYAFIEENRIVFATDTPLQDNAIYSVDIETRRIEKEYVLPGPCIYGKEYVDKGEKCHCFATSVEPDSSLEMWRYRFTYKLGKGVKDKYSHIILRKDKNNYKELFKEKKDFWPIWLLQFGNIQFPNCLGNGEVIINPTALKAMDGRSFKLPLK